MTTGKAKSNSVITHEVAQDGSTITFTVLGAGKLVLELAKLSDANKKRAAIHGLVQRVSDSAAIPFNKDTGYATAAQKHAAMAVVVEHLNSGSEDWKIKRAAGSGGGGDSGILLMALERIYPDKTKEYLQNWLNERKPSERVALQGQEKVKAMIDKIREERAPKDIDVDALLKGLEETEEETSEKVEE